MRTDINRRILSISNSDASVYFVYTIPHHIVTPLLLRGFYRALRVVVATMQHCLVTLGLPF